MSFRSQRELAVLLSKLQGFDHPSFQLEQYATPSSLAAEWVWNMALRGEIAGKVILDAACGPGILGIGVLLLGAKKVFFLDTDQKVLSLCQENYEHIKKEYAVGKAEFLALDIALFDERVDIVVQNPPFGTKTEHADRRFLEKAFSIAPCVYSMHKWSTRRFVESISRDRGFQITEVWKYDFPLPAQFSFHNKPVQKIEVGLWKMEKVTTS